MIVNCLGFGSLKLFHTLENFYPYLILNRKRIQIIYFLFLLTTSSNTNYFNIVISAHSKDSEWQLPGEMQSSCNSCMC